MYVLCLYVTFLFSIVYTKYGNVDVSKHISSARFINSTKLYIVTIASIFSVCIFLSVYIPDSKYDYNAFHPFTSSVPVILYALLRNCHPYLRGTHSRLFSWFGRCSLETFICQFHIYLAMDTRGILTIFPGKGWLLWTMNFILTAIVFVWISDRVAQATGTITSACVGSAKNNKDKKWYQQLSPYIGCLLVVAAINHL